MTENYIVFVEQPFKFELMRYPKLLLQRKPLKKIFSWNPKENVSCFILFHSPSPYISRVYLSLTQIRFYVVEKDTGKVVDSHFVAPSCCIFHHIKFNAYEEDGKSTCNIRLYKWGI